MVCPDYHQIVSILVLLEFRFVTGSFVITFGLEFSRERHKRDFHLRHVYALVVFSLVTATDLPQWTLWILLPE
jgi:hypothetical protein